jgi:phosphoglycerate dehydrogenase-like enzyme
MIYLAKNIKHAEKGISQRRVLNVLGTELYNKTLTIVSLGSIGTPFVSHCQKNFEYQVQDIGLMDCIGLYVLL